MKKLVFIAVLLFTTFSFAQDLNSVHGKITDLESNNSPLMFANVSIKETGAKTTTDENGLYKFNNLKDGTYTLVVSFTGYQSKEFKINTISKKHRNINVALEASALSLDDLMLVMASADNKTNTTEKDN